jgi:Mg2+ and Co2+ transporter CorA
MRVLTFVTVLLGTLAVIAGAMGMNFKAPLFDDPGNFLVVVAAMGVLAAAILGFARWRHWV